MRDSTLRITSVRQPDDVRVFETSADARAPRELRLDEIACERVFEPHPGWRGKLERTAR